MLLDFGIALELARAAGESDGAIFGTPLHVSPRAGPGEGADARQRLVRAVGVMLYEALTGRPPFEGSSMDLLVGTASLEVIPPSTWARWHPAPTWRRSSARSLAEEDPGRRPEGAGDPPGASWSHLHHRAAGPALRRHAAGETRSSWSVARDQLEALREALDVVSTGQAVTLRVSGGAGMGKSTLVQHFLDDPAGGGEVLTLSGRAYERGVRFSTRQSTAWSTRSRGASSDSRRPRGRSPLPGDAAALARLFPVLASASSSFARIAEQPGSTIPLRYPATKRSSALRELYLGIASRRLPATPRPLRGRRPVGTRPTGVAALREADGSPRRAARFCSSSTYRADKST